MYVNQILNRIIFRINTGYYLELSTPETMKLLGSTKSGINKDENDVLHLEITEVVFVHSNIVNICYQENWRVLYIFVPIKQFGESLDIPYKILYF